MKTIKIKKTINAFPVPSNTGFNILTNRKDYEETSGTSSNGYDRNVATIRTFWKDDIVDRVTSYPTSSTDYVSYNSLSIPNLSQSYDFGQKIFYLYATSSYPYVFAAYPKATYLSCSDDLAIVSSSISYGTINKSFWPMDNNNPGFFTIQNTNSTGSIVCPINNATSSNVIYNTENSFEKYFVSYVGYNYPYDIIKGDLSSHGLQEDLSFIVAPSGNYSSSLESYTDGNSYKNNWTKTVERFQYSTSSIIPIPRPSFTYTNFYATSLQYSIVNGNFTNNGLIYVTDKLSGKKPFYNSYDNFISDFKTLTKNYSILPEYITEPVVEDYILNGKKQVNYNYLYTYGKNDEFVNFNTNLLSSSFITTDVVSDMSYNDLDYKLDKIKINCESIIKLLPYNNFYPQTRALKIVDNFQKSFFNYTSDNILLDNNITSNLYSSSNTPYVSGATLNHQLQTVVQQFFAPGVLFNSIKSGMGVTYPAFVTSSVPFSSSTPPSFYNMMITDYDVPKSQSIYTSYTIDANYNKFFNIQDLLDIENSLTNFYDQTSSLYYLAPTAYDNYYIRGKPRYPQYSMKPDFKNINKGVLSAKDDRYKFSVHNYLSEIVNTFIEQSSLTTFLSKPETEFGVFQSGSEYSMIVLIEKQNKDLKMFVNYSTLRPNLETRFNITPASLFGPPTRYFNSSSTSIRGTTDYMADIAFAPYLPPYHFGSSKVMLKFIPNETREYTAQEVIKNLIFEDVATQDIKNAFNTIPFAPTDYSETPAFNNIQSLKRCLNISLTKDRYIDINEEVGSTVSNTQTNKISIQTSFESPILNFNNLDNINASEFFDYLDPSPTYDRDTANFVGMWSGYGSVPSEGDQVVISLLESGQGLSLLDKCFSKTNLKKNIGQINSSTELSEAVILIPYTYHNSTEYADTTLVNLENGIDKSNEQSIKDKPYYFKIEKEIINNILNDDDKLYRLYLGNTVKVEPDYLRQINERLDKLNSKNSIVSCLKNMQKYVLPPHLDWLRDQSITPFAMYFIEFSESLDKQDLSDVWQGLLPTCGTEFKVKNSSIEHDMGEQEFFHNKKLPPDLRFKVFKVKKRAKTNYYELTSDLEDDRKFRGKIGHDEEVVPLYSYNWPHDHYSLIQGAKVNVELQISKEKE